MNNKSQLNTPDQNTALDAVLVLEDGFTLRGRSFTGECESGGEVIFNTGMTGYQEVLTDPSYCGQMVCMTYPLIGNYGINPEDMESEKVHAAALLVKECCKSPSNWRSQCGLPEFLKRFNVPGLEGLDTRALTLHLRRHGAMRGIVSTNPEDVADPRKAAQKAQKLPTMEGQNLVDRVKPESPWRFVDGRPQAAAPDGNSDYKWAAGKKRLVVYDYGIKWNILRLLAAENFDMLMVPPKFTAAQTASSGAEAVFLSNGPGDPAVLGEEIAIVRELAAKFPIAGICLGHQLLGHALGAKTVKLKFGHHGCNHPVKDLQTGKVQISSQNHGFCVDLAGVADLEVTHVNLNDNTLEGFRHKQKPIMAIQHHPEAAPGPADCKGFMARFAEMCL